MLLVICLEFVICFLEFYSTEFMHILRLPLATALSTLRANIGRSAMTVIGTTVGIAMVIIVFSAGAGIKGLVLGELSQFGDNWIHVEVKIPSAKHFSQENASGQSRGVTITTLTNADANAIAGLKNIEDIYATLTSQAVVSNGNEKKRPILFGVGPAYNRMDGCKVASGRFFTDNENAAAAEVAVLGYKLKDNLFGNADAVGKSVRVNGKSYNVLGIMEECGTAGFFDQNAMMILPVKTVQKKLLNVNHVLMMLAQVKDTKLIATTADEIIALLRDRHDITNPDKDDFAVNTVAESQELVGTVFLGITWLLVGLAAISLLVGGVGILNVMYTSVAERTFEIGLRKAVGATSKDIMYQFLAEAVALTLSGGIAGIIIGVIISYAIAVIARSFGLNWTFSISPFSLLISVTFSTIVGLIFGLYPARQAARMDPMAAIREEG